MIFSSYILCALRWTENIINIKIDLTFGLTLFCFTLDVDISAEGDSLESCQAEESYHQWS